jgi:hypothetical protein
MTKTLIHIGLLAFAATGSAVALDEAPAGLKDYTCWMLLTEPDENQGSAEVFYLGYALGRAGLELKEEGAYKQAIADVLERCRAEPDTRVLDAFDAAIKRS